MFSQNIHISALIHSHSYCPYPIKNTKPGFLQYESSLTYSLSSDIQIAKCSLYCVMVTMWTVWDLQAVCSWLVSSQFHLGFLFKIYVHIVVQSCIPLPQAIQPAGNGSFWLTHSYPEPSPPCSCERPLSCLCDLTDIDGFSLGIQLSFPNLWLPYFSAIF